MYQHAYKKGHSATTALTQMTDDRMKEMDKKKSHWCHIVGFGLEASAAACVRTCLFPTRDLSLFWADFPKSLKTDCRGLRSAVRRVVETDSWLRSGGNLGHFPSQPITVWWHPFFCEDLKEVGNKPETLVCSVPLGYLGCPRLSSEGTVFIREPLKIQAPIHLQFDIYFPGACKSHLRHSPLDFMFLLTFLCRLGWPIRILLPVPLRSYMFISMSVIVR